MYHPIRNPRRIAHEMARVDLDLLTPLGTHLLQRALCVLPELFVLDRTQTHDDTRGVRHRVGLHLEEIGGESAGGCSEDELEGVAGVKLKTRQLRRFVSVGRRDGGESLAVSVDIQRTKLRLGEVEGRPFQRDGCLGDVAYFQLWRLWQVLAKLVENLVLQLPECVVPFLLLGNVLMNSDIDYRASRSARR